MYVTKVFRQPIKIVLKFFIKYKRKIKGCFANKLKSRLIYALKIGNYKLPTSFE